MTRDLPWADDALEIGPASDPVTIRYSFGALAEFDREARGRGLPMLWASIGSVGIEAAALFLLCFAEADGAPAYPTFGAAADALRALGFPAVAEAYVAVFDRSTEEFGLVRREGPEPGAEGKG